jgi:hypothetical protein
VPSPPYLTQITQMTTDFADFFCICVICVNLRNLRSHVRVVSTAGYKERAQIGVIITSRKGTFLTDCGTNRPAPLPFGMGS